MFGRCSDGAGPDPLVALKYDRRRRDDRPYVTRDGCLIDPKEPAAPSP